jgi:hypothetical protein
LLLLVELRVDHGWQVGPAQVSQIHLRGR